ncbi:hypothetical protein AVI51_03155 [Piscirickettsia salmonis]|uniref:Uncharacterized protein n=1 Tax=Piscirickettsia salmonis TaxID=1238 RepID=A0A9Q6LML3_PISSA|nr:hypothetical protein [Piscirickettsia salmonis]ALA25068.1 membrane protein [Piscirickettsia salmonis]APS45350.1 hypothetical protein AVI48_13870 [Piscirickettsia salmonis]APS48710.1 hypothetical protein AVI49_14480 [Piscirickettsia salmonis]APS49953.1 hypothetical protein AVI50_03195 [Piscirickettsia salmonis]APS53146.1 hypothetical protein AVI51_03155 [Piscirickettsia salmonis]
MNIKKILTLVPFVILTVSPYASANNYCQKARDLRLQVSAYTCPKRDFSLALNLAQAIDDKNFVQSVCAQNQKKDYCLSGVLSFPTEANGLSSIAIMEKKKACLMAKEDQEQINLYLSAYLLSKQCFNSKAVFFRDSF